MSSPPRYCYRHPDRETGLSCSECGRPICYECMTPAAVGLRCPDHSGKPQGVRRVATAAARATGARGSALPNAVTLALIGVNVLVYAAELAAGGSVNGTDNTIYVHGVLVNDAVYADGTPAGVAHGEWWRLITSAFLHYGPLHLGMNMLSLYFAGSILEQAVGRWRYVLLYLVSGLAGAAGALYWTPHGFTVGASGAIFGVLGALLVLERRGNIATGGQVAGLIVLNLVITLAYRSQISVGGHVGGLVGGLLLMLAFVRFLRSWELSLAAAALVAAAAVIVAYASI
ncbi:MAG TPA: rhomboid family intramembrane serine protease [Gaiellaceae bacterium]|nr:rhomboid family intramembrane serine protease [Gaiellaceae bacterium]